MNITVQVSKQLHSVAKWHSFVAQLVEHWTSKPKVAGSIHIGVSTAVKQFFSLSDVVLPTGVASEQ